MYILKIFRLILYLKVFFIIGIISEAYWNPKMSKMLNLGLHIIYKKVYKRFLCYYLKVFYYKWYYIIFYYTLSFLLFILFYFYYLDLLFFENLKIKLVLFFRSKVHGLMPLKFVATKAELHSLSYKVHLTIIFLVI